MWHDIISPMIRRGVGVGVGGGDSASKNVYIYRGINILLTSTKYVFTEIYNKVDFCKELLMHLFH